MKVCSYLFSSLREIKNTTCSQAKQEMGSDQTKIIAHCILALSFKYKRIIIMSLTGLMMSKHVRGAFYCF